MKTAKLHELIQLAKEGKQFKATRPGLVDFIWDRDFKSCDKWSVDAVLSDWEYQEIREPEVVETKVQVDRTGFWTWEDEEYQKLKGKKWKVVCTEVMDD